MFFSAASPVLVKVFLMISHRQKEQEMKGHKILHTLRSHGGWNTACGCKQAKGNILSHLNGGAVSQSDTEGVGQRKLKRS